MTKKQREIRDNGQTEIVPVTKKIEKPLVSKRKKNATIYNATTGEVLADVNNFIQTYDSESTFIKVYVDNMLVFLGLSDVAKSIIAMQLSQNFMNKQIFINNNTFKSFFYVDKSVADLKDARPFANLKTSKPTYIKAIKELVTKGVLLPLEIPDDIEKQDVLREKLNIASFADDIYIINPNIAIKGTTEQVIREIVEIYDFVNLKAQRATRITTTSDGRKEIKGNKDLVIDAKIVEPQPKEPQALPAPQPQPKSDKEIELELIQAKAELLDKQNRAKELDIEEKEVDLEILRQQNISEGKIKPDLDLDSPEANQQEKIALFEEFIKQMAENGSMFGTDIAKDFQAKLKELK